MRRGCDTIVATLEAGTSVRLNHTVSIAPATVFFAGTAFASSTVGRVASIVSGSTMGRVGAVRGVSSMLRAMRGVSAMLCAMRGVGVMRRVSDMLGSMRGVGFMGRVGVMRRVGSMLCAVRGVGSMGRVAAMRRVCCMLCAVRRVTNMLGALSDVSTMGCVAAMRRMTSMLRAAVRGAAVLMALVRSRRLWSNVIEFLLIAFTSLAGGNRFRLCVLENESLMARIDGVGVTLDMNMRARLVILMLTWPVTIDKTKINEAIVVVRVRHRRLRMWVRNVVTTVIVSTIAGVGIKRSRSSGTIFILRLQNSLVVRR